MKNNKLVIKFERKLGESLKAKFFFSPKEPHTLGSCPCWEVVRYLAPLDKDLVKQDLQKWAANNFNHTYSGGEYGYEILSDKDKYNYPTGVQMEHSSPFPAFDIKQSKQFEKVVKSAMKSLLYNLKNDSKENPFFAVYNDDLHEREEYRDSWQSYNALKNLFDAVVSDKSFRRDPITKEQGTGTWNMLTDVEKKIVEKYQKRLDKIMAAIIRAPYILLEKELEGLK